VLSRQKSKLEFAQEYTGSAKNVITSVLLGKADAGATFATELEKESSDVRHQIRTILVTPKIAPHPLSAHPRIALPLREALRTAVLALASTADGARLLQSVRLATPIAADYKRDYQALEEFDVKVLSNWGK